MVVQAGTADLGLVEVEAERFDEVQFRARVGREADRVARIGRYAGLMEQMEHSRHSRPMDSSPTTPRRRSRSPSESPDAHSIHPRHRPPRRRRGGSVRAVGLGTFIWLAILFVTTIVAHRVGAQDLTRILQSRSTNLRHLMHDPVPSLVRSAFWIDGDGWFLYAIAYAAIHATVERWLGTMRWLLVVVVAHVGATYISQSVLLWAIDTGRAPESQINVIDIGVSYGLAGVAGLLTFRLAWKWRAPYLVALLALCLTPVVGPFLDGGHPTFTDIGHLCAALHRARPYPVIRATRRSPASARISHRFTFTSSSVSMPTSRPSRPTSSSASPNRTWPRTRCSRPSPACIR